MHLLHLTSSFSQLTWSDHDFILLGAHPHEGQIVLGVNVSDGGPGLHQQLVDQSSVLDSTGAVQSRFDGDSSGEKK